MDQEFDRDPVKSDAIKLQEGNRRAMRVRRSMDFRDLMSGQFEDQATHDLVTDTFRAVVAKGGFDSLTMTQIGAASLIALGYSPGEVRHALPGMVTVFDLNMWGGRKDFVDAISAARDYLSGRAQAEPSEINYADITYENAQEILGGLLRSHLDVLRARSQFYEDDPLLSSGILVESYKNVGGEAVRQIEYDSGLVDGLLKNTRELLKLKNLYKGEDEDDGGDNPVLTIMVGEGVPTRAPNPEEYGKEPG